MKNLLIVEDDKALNEGYSSILNDEYTVFSAFDGRSALDILEREQIDLIILDLIMPNMNGLETLQKIKERNKDVKTIILTALISESIETSLMSLGANAYLRKPVSVRELINEVKKILKE